jgi:hypothetical protein
MGRRDQQEEGGGKERVMGMSMIKVHSMKM